MDDVAHAISDPVRREILVALHTTRLTAGQLAERFPISRPAVSRHLRVLRESGLVRDELTGRQRVYALNVAALTDLAEWIDQIRQPAEWQQRLDALETEVYRTRRDRRARRPEDNEENTA